MQAKIVEVDAENKVDLKVDPRNPRKFDIIMAVLDENNESSLNVMAETTDGDDEDAIMANFSIRLKSFDEDKKKWVEDESTTAEAERIATEVIGAGSLSELVETSGMGFSFTGYTDGERGFFQPFTPYTRFSKLEAADAKKLRSMSGPFGVVPITDNARFNRFNFGISADIDGENKIFRVAQIEIESDNEDDDDELISVKYSNKVIDSFINGEGESVEPERREAAKRGIALMVKRERARAVKRLNDALGVDVEKLVESGDESIQFQNVTVNKIAGSSTYFLVGRPVAEDE